MKSKKTEAQRLIEKQERERLELMFITQLKQYGLPDPIRQFRFCERNWRFDFVFFIKQRFEIDGCPPCDDLNCNKCNQFKHPLGGYCRLSQPIAVEIQGGTWSNGAHVRPEQYKKDREKINHAQRLGWKVFEFTVDHLNNLYAIDFMRKVL